jgi:N-acetylglutamate synthase-like GNAT family acetyltransferase
MTEASCKRLIDKIQLFPVDLNIHRTKLTKLLEEYAEWLAKEAKEHYQIDYFAVGETSISEYVAHTINKLLSDTSSPHIYYLVELEGATIGMGALHQTSENTAEIKRMYIQPAYRGKGYGKTLLQQLLEKAKELGCHTIHIETARFMTAAQNLYQSFGFIERNEYPETEIPPQLKHIWLYMEKTLEDTTK